MPTKPAFWPPTPTVLLLVFGLTLSYTGAGFNLHRLSICGLVLALWLASSIVRLEPSALRLAWGWLPAVIVAYLAWLFVAPLLSTYPYASSTTAMGLAVLPLTFIGWLLLPTAHKQRSWYLLWLLLMTCGVVLAAWGTADFLLKHEQAHASFLDSNAYAALINLILIPAVYLYLSAPPGRGGLDQPYMLLSVVTLLALGQFMSFSRGALLAFLAVLPAVLWLSRARPAFRRRVAWLLLALAGAYLAATNVPFAPQKGNLGALILAPEERLEGDSSVQARIFLLKSTWRMIGDSSLLAGSGLGTFKIRYSAYRDAEETSLGNFAHNDYLQAIHDGGLVQFTFFLLLTVVAPAWILRKSHLDRSRSAPTSDSHIATGLMLGVMSISLHALVNFIHFVAPMIFLTGLYLARGWEAVQAPRRLALPPPIADHVKPGLLKGVAILLLATPITVLLVDGVIFRLFATDDPLHARLTPEHRASALNLALALRPSNPVPRIILVRAMLAAAEKAASPVERKLLLDQAEREVGALSANAPALAIARYFVGKIQALRDTPSDLVQARDHLERAVQLVPPATGMRRDLVRVYRKLGQEEQAYQTVLEARQWVSLETDMRALAAFAQEAQSVARHKNDANETKFWTSLHARLTVLGYAD